MRGYTTVPNRVEEAITHARFTATQLKVVRCVVRLTYGRHRRAAAISVPQLAAACGRKHSRGFRRQLCALVNNGVVIRVTPAAGRAASSYRLNTNFERWGDFSVPVRELERVFDKLT